MLLLLSLTGQTGRMSSKVYFECIKPFNLFYLIKIDYYGYNIFVIPFETIIIYKIRLAYLDKKCFGLTMTHGKNYLFLPKPQPNPFDPLPN